MCGIAGFEILGKAKGFPFEKGQKVLERMIWPLKHRGPDGFGFFLDKNKGLAHARLSIIDLEGGWQPISNEDDSIWVVFNGEIFNYVELRKELETQGHHFSTSSDTEVIVHLYEEKGLDFPVYLNGQFAIALLDLKKDRLILSRDRYGIRPLFYSRFNDRFFFASEIKSIFNADNALKREIDPQAIRDIFTFWSTHGERTSFKDVNQLKPGHLLVINKNHEITVKDYWQIPLGLKPPFNKGEGEICKKLKGLLIDSVRIRLRADVPVGAYLSGGLDSSIITNIIHRYTDSPLKTFSVSFTDKVYDESEEQRLLAGHLGTEHNVVSCSYKKIADLFPRAIWHCECPILRTAPVPLLMLSGLVKSTGYKVVLTGEGADEVFGGYDIFKETKIRLFVSRHPDSNCRPLLFKRLYPYLALSPSKSAAIARSFFETDADPNDPFYSHLPRWKTTSSLPKFLRNVLLDETSDSVSLLEGEIEQDLKRLDWFSRAQYLETALLLSNYLLSSQGDRMAMANSIEGRFPYLDHHVADFAARLPTTMKMKVLDEKYILRKVFENELPQEITRRRKQPYMAPDILSFFGEEIPDYVEYYISDETIRNYGIFKPKAVEKLVSKCRKNARQGFRENMAFVGILSTQILYDKFVSNFEIKTPSRLPNVKVVRRENCQT